ncbi:MAG: ribose-5-phosphate isomerase RpiA [Candidatus Thermoplasmatota archaeon]|nr:ribose-5-phosphate isomerase RpiA [Candidatus Thermoplasmatota archaeon]MCL5963637.1 ribose-5-phosphate isomerase RpiA [Candidatus Thermoplasmatota archaeon]
MNAESNKIRSATEALSYIKDGMVIGLGSGTTASIFIKLVGEFIRDNRIDVIGVATSTASYDLAKNIGIPMQALEDTTDIDITFDGADEVDPELNLIKGKGGALFREKIVALMSDRLVIMVDDSKIVHRLGEKGILPVEVIPVALNLVISSMNNLNIQHHMRMNNRQYYTTDNGNYVMDVCTEGIENTITLSEKLKSITGVIDTGLFHNLADVVIIAYENGKVKKLQKS